MVHTFQALGVNVAVDVNSGAVHVLDELTYRLLEQVTPPMAEHCPEEIKSVLAQFDPNALEEAWQELRSLADEGLLFEKDDYIDREKAASMQQQALVKALCLHVSHDCNLRCKYCFASTGDFGTGHRMTMDYETAKANLMAYHGVGPKVADCVCLFALGHKEAFPQDVWVKRILARHYPNGFAQMDSPFAGVYQQYMFAYERERG